MSADMFRIPTTERKDEILKAAIEIVASEGYDHLSMRVLGCAAGMELGDLHQHFRTWEELVHALVDFVRVEYDRAFEEMAESTRSHGPLETVNLLMYETPGDATLQADRLFPHLWAIAQVEPLMQEVLDDVYARYLDMLEEAFVAAGCPAPRTAARRAGREALLEIMTESGAFQREAQLIFLDRYSGQRSQRAERGDAGIGK